MWLSLSFYFSFIPCADVVINGRTVYLETRHHKFCNNKRSTRSAAFNGCIVARNVYEILNTGFILVGVPPNTGEEPIETDCLANLKPRP